MVLNHETDQGLLFNPSDHRIKDQDKEQIFRIIQSSYPISQKQILKTFHLNPNSLSFITKELLEDNLISVDSSLGNQRRGRPELFFIPNNDRFVCVSIYVDSWTIRCAAVNIKGEIICEFAEEAFPETDSKTLIEIQLKLFYQVKEFISDKSQIIGLAFSLPGNVDTQCLIWKECQRWKNVENIDYNEIASKLGVPIRIYRDLDSALFSQLIMDPSYTQKSVLLVHWGIGLGISFASKGIIISSNHGRFGTIGYTSLAPDSNKKLEDYISLVGIMPYLKRKYPDLVMDESSMYETVKSKDFLDIEEFRTSIKYLGMTMRNLCLTFYPDTVFILSPFCENDKVMEALMDAFKEEQIFENMQSTVQIVPIHNGYRGCVHGSIQKLFESSLKYYLRARF